VSDTHEYEKCCMAMLSVLGRQAGKRSEAHLKGKYEQPAASM